MSMSLLIVAKCDGCGAILGQIEGRATAKGYVETRLKLEHGWPAGVLADERNWQRTKHYCQPCADGATPAEHRPEMANPR